MIFAVVTTSSVLLYDTQHTHPIARIGGCHLATINDAGKIMHDCTLPYNTLMNTLLTCFPLSLQLGAKTDTP